VARTARAIATDGAPLPRAAYSQGKQKDGIVATVQIGDHPVTGKLAEGIGPQTEQALENIRVVLSSAGLGWLDVVKTTCYLADLAGFSEFDLVYGNNEPDPRPSRSTVGVALAGGSLVDIEAWAVGDRD
jgi:2-iminobutanoate/2-iminopropanoate deaminase